MPDFPCHPEEVFPFEIPAEPHRRSESLWKNILKPGNLGKDKKYLRGSGPVHGIQHFWRIAGQTMEFGRYAPAESWLKITAMFRWWGEKVGRMMK